MRKYLAATSLLLLLVLSACSSAPSRSANRDSGARDVVPYARSLIGTPYHYGGESPRTGFDCSGFVRYVYLKTRGIDLPRSTRAMSQVGVRIKGDQLRPGDLVFYSTQGWPFSHVGIYIGNAKFIHSPHTGKTVEIADMSLHYWQAHYNGARRVSNLR
jgi:cell wall-associated NlpC family hydrolase